jgi:hypothetical protein
LKPSLVNMDLSDNPVFTTGSTFNSWLGTLTNLEILRYEDTDFINANGIPTEIGNLKKLGFYECTNVRYSGAISSLAFPSDMTQLSYIEMEFNTFSSPVPTEVGLLPALEFFYARGSSLTGNLEFMRGMNQIQECWTDRNEGLTGNLPTFFGTLSTLVSLSVTRSGWSGQLPTELGLLVTSLRQMYFYDNAFTGQIPSEWGALTNLAELQVENNALTLGIPESVCRLKLVRGMNLEADCAICNLSTANCCSTCALSRAPNPALSAQPSAEPSSSSEPSAQLKSEPSSELSAQPSAEPSFEPSTQPSSEPSSEPSAQPSAHSGPAVTSNGYASIVSTIVVFAPVIASVTTVILV